MQASLVIWLRTVSLSLAGDGDGAIESALSALQFRRALHDAGLPVGDHDTALVLSLTNPSAAPLLRLQQALEAVEDPDRLVEDLLETRARYLEQLWRRYYGSDPNAPHAYLLPYRSIAETIQRPGMSRRIVDTLRIWSDVIEAARTPWPGKLQAADVVHRRYESATFSGAGRHWLAQPALVPAVLWYGPAIALEELRTAVRVRPAGVTPTYGPGQLIVDRSSRVAVAIERYRRDHAGALPDTLEALVPEYLSEVPADPLTGTPLLYRVEPDAYTIYSVGEDLVDDGGVLLQPAPQGSAGSFTSGPDIGIRVLFQASASGL